MGRPHCHRNGARYALSIAKKTYGGNIPLVLRQSAALLQPLRSLCVRFAFIVLLNLKSAVGQYLDDAMCIV